MKYKWLHVSDIHSISGINTNIMRLALLSEIEENRPFSFILITGDLSDKNSGYLESKKLILDIAQKSEVSTNHIFIVPGNHDINRDVPDQRIQKCMNLWNQNQLITSWSTIEELTRGQNDFFSSYKDILHKEYPIDSLHFYEKYDNNLAVIHLNTAWMCCDSDNEFGKLHLGLDKLYKLFQNNDDINNTPIKIAIGHHRLDDFNETVRNNFRTLLNEFDIDLYLGGHCHKSSIIYDPAINAELCSCRQARAEDVNYPAGFIIGNIDTNTDQCYFEFYNWDTTLSKWTYDYSVNSAKHGKYYLNHPRYKKRNYKNIVVDLKLIGTKFDNELVFEKYSHLALSEVYRTSLVNIKPQEPEEWTRCFNEIYNLFCQVIYNSRQDIHIFPLAPIPLLVYFGFLLQNNSPNIHIYQYHENAYDWVFSEAPNDPPIFKSTSLVGNRILALSVSISASIQENDIAISLDTEFDLVSISIKSPGLSTLNHKNDVEKVKLAIKNAIDNLHSNYEELHLFLAAPAGLCIEIGRLIRMDMFPNTFIYQYNSRMIPKYTRIANVMELVH